MIFQNISNMRKLTLLCTQSHIYDFIHRVFPFVIFIGGTRHGCRKVNGLMPKKDSTHH